MTKQENKIPGKKKKNDGEILIQKIDIRQIHRASADIETWRTAMKTAESIINPTRKRLYDLYHEMLLDGRLKSVYGRRLRNISNTPIVFKQDEKTNDDIAELIKNSAFKKILKYIVESRLWGYSLMELDFDRTNNKIKPTLIDRRHVKPELGIVTRSPYDIEGEHYDDPFYSRFVLPVGEEKDLGELLAACQYVIYKRGGFGDWAQFAEIFGMPFRKGTYDGYDEGTREKLVEALDAAGSASYAVIPKGSDIEFLQNSGNAGSNSLYKQLRDACNEEITILILGATLTTSAGDKGARSLGDVHERTEDEIFHDDKAFVLDTLNEKLLPLLQMHGWNVEGGSFAYPDVDTISLKDRIEMDIKIAERQPVEDDYFYEKYGIPKPENYDQMKTEAEERKQQFQQQTKVKEDDAKNALQKFFNLFSFKAH